MDTKRALTVIIILLILMNITLGIYLIVINSGRSNIEDTLAYTRTILNNRNYKLECTIPERATKLSTVTLSENRFTEQSVDSVMEKTGGTAFVDSFTGIMYITYSGEGLLVPIDMSRTSIEAAAAEFMISVSIDRNQFILDYYRETSNESYELKYITTDDSNNLYFGSYVRLTISNTGIQSAEIMYPDIADKIEGQGEGVPVYTILLANLLETGSEKSIISINSGYYSDNPGEGIVGISWRIRFSDGEERFFDAATGAEFD